MTQLGSPVFKIRNLEVRNSMLWGNMFIQFAVHHGVYNK